MDGLNIEMILNEEEALSMFLIKLCYNNCLNFSDKTKYELLLSVD